MARAAEESEGWPSEDKRAVESGVDPDPPLNQVESAGDGQDGGDEAVKLADAPLSEPAIPSEECRGDSGRQELDGNLNSPYSN